MLYKELLQRVGAVLLSFCEINDGFLGHLHVLEVKLGDVQVELGLTPIVDSL